MRRGGADVLTLDSDEVVVLSHLQHDVCRDVLAGSRRDVVNHCGAHIHRPSEVLLHAPHGGLAVVRVDLERGVHADVEPLLRGVERLPCAVASGVADDLDVSAKSVHGVRDEHDVLVPRHELALSRRPADDHALHAVLYLVLEQRVVARQVELSALEVGGLERANKPRFSQVLHSRRRAHGRRGALGRHMASDALPARRNPRPARPARLPHRHLLVNRRLEWDF